MFRLIATAVLVLTLGGGTLAAERLSTGWSGIAEAEVRLVAGHVAGEGDMLGLQFALAPGWKVYWRTPGDAGFPPRANWAGTEGASGFTFEWPLPERFTFYGLETFGYGKQVVLPVRLTRRGEAVQLRLNLFYAACSDICVPVQTDLALDLPAGSWPVNHHSRALARALATVPDRSGEAVTVSSARHAGSEWLFELATGTRLQDPDLIVEASDDWVFGRPRCKSGTETVRCEVPVVDGPTASENAIPVTVTLVAEGFAAETTAALQRD